jgi:hypothetical protein
MRSCNQRGPSGVVNGMLLSLAAIHEEERACLRPPVLGVALTFGSKPAVARNASSRYLTAIAMPLPLHQSGMRLGAGEAGLRPLTDLLPLELGEREWQQGPGISQAARCLPAPHDVPCTIG